MSRSRSDPRTELIHLLGGATLFLVGLVALFVLSGVPLVTVGSTTITLSAAGAGLILVSALTYVYVWQQDREYWMLARAVAAGAVVLGVLVSAAGDAAGIGPLGTVGSVVVVLSAIAFAVIRWVPESTWERIPIGSGSAGGETDEEGDDAGS